METLFKGSADIVQQYADNAYRTAGLSANQYMETVTSFSASLLQSLNGDTLQAANVADMAITDMSDNANKMGTSMESIQNAYQGFAKQNYTMLDNLKLGYGGTKEEMERLLADAEEFSGIRYDISSLNDVYQAIHVVQTELGITGTTAKEASTTIQGSVNAMKSAWNNLVTGIADDNSNFSVLVDNFVDSVSIAGENIIPRVETAINGIGELVERLAPVISEKIPVIVNNVLPNILNAATTLINGLISGLVSMLPTIVQSGGDMLMSLLQGILDSTPQIVDGAVAAVLAFVDFVTQNLPHIAEMGIQIIIQLAAGIIKAIPQLVARVPQIISSIIQAIKAEFNSLLNIGRDIINKIWDGLKSGISQAATWGKDLINNFVSGIKSKFANVKNAISNVAGVIRSVIHFSEPDIGPLADFHTYAPDMMKSFAEGIRKNEKIVTDQVKKSFDFGGYIGDSFGTSSATNGSSVTSSGFSRNNTTFGNIIFNISGVDNKEEIAQYVAVRLQDMISIRNSAFGGGAFY